MCLNPNLLKRIAKNSVKEFFHSNRVLAPNLLDLGLPYLALGFSKEGIGESMRRELLAKKIMEVIANAESVNTVKIYYKKSPNQICERMAKSL